MLCDMQPKQKWNSFFQRLHPYEIENIMEITVSVDTAIENRNKQVSNAKLVQRKQKDLQREMAENEIK